MRPEDKAAIDRIEFLEYQLDAADLALEAKEAELRSALEQINRLRAERDGVD